MPCQSPTDWGRDTLMVMYNVHYKRPENAKCSFESRSLQHRPPYLKFVSMLGSLNLPRQFRRHSWPEEA
jgi:hypothetical protein